jgi:hypothetical protein
MKSIKISLTLGVSFIMVLLLFWLLESYHPSGTLLLAITSSSENVEIEEIDDIGITVRSIALHHPEYGWRVVSSAGYDLLLTNLNKKKGYILLDTATVNDGYYDMIKFSLNNTITLHEETSFPAQNPELNIEIPADILINKAGTSSVLFTINIPESIYQKNDSYLFLPNIQLESRVNPRLQRLSDNSYTIVNGNVTTKNIVHVDLEGNTRYGDRHNEKEKTDTVRLNSDSVSPVENN